MHEYFAISVHFVVFYTVFNQKPWHFATFSRKKTYAYPITSNLIGTNLTRIGNLKVDIARLRSRRELLNSLQVL